MESPDTWSDAAAWDAHYRKHKPKLSAIEKYDLEHALRFAGNFLATPRKRIWFAGCGVEWGPWLHAYLGCDVIGTDVSAFAIAFQQALVSVDPMEELEKLPNVLKEMELPLANQFQEPAYFVHDMRTAFPLEPVNAVLNVRTFHGFPVEEQRRVAVVYFDALTAGGLLVCDTLNVQGQDRTHIENALLQAGFMVPGVEAEQWYRQQLDATGILYTMVLGNPVIPQWGQYEGKGGEAQAEQDRVALRSFRNEYLHRRKANAEQDQARYREGVDKLAYVMYNTG